MSLVRLGNKGKGKGKAFLIDFSMEIMKYSNDEFNIIRKIETKNGNLVIYVTYAQPGIGH